MSDKIEPALSPEEWAERYVYVANEGAAQADAESVVTDPATGAHESCFFSGRARHALAALALHGQPFGFDRLHVASLRQLAEHARKIAAPVGPQHALWDSIFAAEEAADRIEALLPPAPLTEGEAP